MTISVSAAISGSSELMALIGCAVCGMLSGQSLDLSVLSAAAIVAGLVGVSAVLVLSGESPEMEPLDDVGDDSTPLDRPTKWTNPFSGTTHWISPPRYETSDGERYYPGWSPIPENGVVYLGDGKGGRVQHPLGYDTYYDGFSPDGEPLEPRQQHPGSGSGARG